jgi:transcriptional regulator with XRE-family HTH domain
MMRIDPARNPLRRARLAAGLQIRDLATRTRISPSMLRHIDEGEFHRLPAGIYARAWVRSVAQAVGLDPVEVLRDLEEVLPRAVDPLEHKGPDGSDSSRKPPQAFAPVAPVRFMDRWRRAAAAALDGIILSSISIAVWIATATAGGVDPAALGMPGGFAIGAITAAVAAAYFVLFAGIAGRTPGAMLLAYPQDEDRERLSLNEIGRRAGQTALQESSIVVDLMLPADLPPNVEGRSVRA